MKISRSETTGDEPMRSERFIRTTVARSRFNTVISPERLVMSSLSAAWTRLLHFWKQTLLWKARIVCLSRYQGRTLFHSHGRSTGDARQQHLQPQHGTAPQGVDRSRLQLASAPFHRIERSDPPIHRVGTLASAAVTAKSRSHRKELRRHLADNASKTVAIALQVTKWSSLVSLGVAPR